jgi:hypothetical protein
MKTERVIINTNAMTLDELDALIHELRDIRKRKQEAQSFLDRFAALIEEAEEQNFNFTDKDFGHILQKGDYVLYDFEKGHHYNA